MPFQSTANTLSDKERALQKEHCRSFAENGRGPDSQYPLSCAPVFLALVKQWTHFDISMLALPFKYNDLNWPAYKTVSG